MDRQAMIEELRSIIADYLRAQGLDLVDLIYRYEGSGLVLRVLVDKPEGGISLDECGELNEKVGKILDEREFLQERYVLEVSSPGLDRLLCTKSDFLRCINKKIKFFLNDKIKGKIEWDGIITKVEGDSLYIDSHNGIIEIPLSKINKARQIIYNI